MSVGEDAVWDGITGFDDLCADPALIWGRSLAEVLAKLGSHFRSSPLRDGEGWKLIHEDQFVSYSSGSSRHGRVPYYKISSGVVGKIKVVGPGYLPSANDNATLVYAE